MLNTLIGNIMSRKKFLETVLLLFLLPIAWLVSSTIRKNKEWTIPSFIKVPDNFSKEVNFLNKVIVIKTAQQVNFLSSSCTHLGCRINKVENNELLCPCHGSKFNLKGEVIKGPATEALPNFPHSYNKDKKEFTVVINNAV